MQVEDKKRSFSLENKPPWYNGELPRTKDKEVLTQEMNEQSLAHTIFLFHYIIP